MSEEISRARYEEVEQLKGVIGWSWLEVSSRVGWAPVGLTQFKQLKRPIDERWLQYLREVAHAVGSVPVPQPINETPEVEPGDTVIVPQAAFDEVAPRLRAAGFIPQADTESTEVRVMLLDDIASKLAAEYVALRRNTEMSPENREGAQWMIGRLAEQMGVTHEVRRLVSAPPPAVERAAEPARMPQMPPTRADAAWTPPQPSREIGGLDTF